MFGLTDRVVHFQPCCMTSVDWAGSVNAIAGNKGAIYEVIDTLTQDVGVKDIFSNRPATVT